MIRMSDDDFELQIFKCAVTRVKPYICTMPLRMDEGWNQIQFNLVDFTKRAYGTNYVETLRVQVHANCRLRRIYFSDRLYSEEELPPEFKLYLPMQSHLVLFIMQKS
ncbi:Cilia- and flagella-associated protein 20 [Glycine soja]